MPSDVFVANAATTSAARRLTLLWVVISCEAADGGALFTPICCRNCPPDSAMSQSSPPAVTGIDSCIDISPQPAAMHKILRSTLSCITCSLRHCSDLVHGAASQDFACRLLVPLPPCRCGADTGDFPAGELVFADDAAAVGCERKHCSVCLKTGAPAASLSARSEGTDAVTAISSSGCNHCGSAGQSRTTGAASRGMCCSYLEFCHRLPGVWPSAAVQHPETMARPCQCPWVCLHPAGLAAGEHFAPMPSSEVQSPTHLWAASSSKTMQHGTASQRR